MFVNLSCGGGGDLRFLALSHLLDKSILIRQTMVLCQMNSSSFDDEPLKPLESPYLILAEEALIAGVVSGQAGIASASISVTVLMLEIAARTTRDLKTRHQRLLLI